MKNDPGPGRALAAALILGVLYAEGGVLRIFSSLILLAVLITPAGQGQPSLLQGLIEFGNEVLVHGIPPQAMR